MEVSCCVCGKEFEDEFAEEIEGYIRVSFCTECMASGKHIPEVVKLYKIEHRIPEDESVMVRCGQDGEIKLIIRERDIIERCKSRGMKPEEYMKPEYLKDGVNS